MRGKEGVASRKVKVGELGEEGTGREAESCLGEVTGLCGIPE